MFKKLVMIGLLGICIAMLGIEAIAGVCIAKVGGTCVAWSGSVECQIGADQIGSLSKNPKLQCQIDASGEGVLACANQGAGKAAPGIQLRLVTETETFGAFAPILKQNISGGVATVDVTTSLSTTSLEDLADAFCPNANWSGIGYVPCEANITFSQTDNSGTLDAKTYHCELPSCDTLGFDEVTHKFERRQYDCCQVGVDPNCP